jgi:hypothetical protein
MIVIVVMIVLLVMTVLPVMIVTEMIATTAGMIEPRIAATVRGLRLVAPTLMIVAPGLRPPGGRMIEGLQGTILIEPPVQGTTEDATRRMIEVTTRGLREMEMADGRVKMVHGSGTLAPSENGQRYRWFFPNLMVLVSEKLALTCMRAESVLCYMARWSLSRSR